MSDNDETPLKLRHQIARLAIGGVVIWMIFSAWSSWMGIRRGCNYHGYMGQCPNEYTHSWQDDAGDTQKRCDEHFSGYPRQEWE